MSIFSHRGRALSFGLAGLSTVLALSASVSADPVPSYAKSDESLHGRISTFDGKYHLQVRDDRGYLDDVTMHQGTIINPVGLELHQGMRVTIMGRNDGKTFQADEIDTPYEIQYTYPPPAVLYPYPAAPYPAAGGWYNPYGQTTIIVRPHDDDHGRSSPHRRHTQ